MGFERIWLFQQVELQIETVGEYTFEFLTDLPGAAMAVRRRVSFTTATTVNIRLPGSTRGRLYAAKLYGAAEARLYRGRVFAKPLGPPGPTGWAWYALPIVTTPEAYGAAALPIRPTPEGYGEAPLPIAPTPEGYSAAALPIRGTPEEWTAAPLPLAGTSLIPRWIDLPVDE